MNHAWIAAHIPHQGAMCLLDEVLEWRAEGISCRASSHHLRTNPLRTNDQLLALCGIEYAAQAIAVHGALCMAQGGAAAEPTPGMLASVRNVTLGVERLDDIASDLLVRAERVGGDATALLYEFALHADARRLLCGRATIYLRVPAK